MQILLCEDNQMMGMVTRFALEAEGHRVTLAKSSEEAVKTAASLRPEIILLDLNLPSEGGAHVMSELKRHEFLRAIPVLLFSAEDHLAETAARLGASGFIQKPFEVADLLKEIRRVT